MSKPSILTLVEHVNRNDGVVSLPAGIILPSGEVTDEDASLIAGAIRNNDTATELNCDNSVLSVEGIKTLVGAVNDNPNIKKVFFNLENEVEREGMSAISKINREDVRISITSEMMNIAKHVTLNDFLNVPSEILQKKLAEIPRIKDTVETTSENLNSFLNERVSSVLHRGSAVIKDGIKPVFVSRADGRDNAQNNGHGV